jgi:hypothetical protein
MLLSLAILVAAENKRWQVPKTSRNRSAQVFDQGTCLLSFGLVV